MKRKKRNERVEKLRGQDTDSFMLIRQKASQWANGNTDVLRGAHSSLPDDLDDRAADNWEPLVAIADLAGGGWPKRFRDVALKLSGNAEVDLQSTGTQLLAAIRNIFEIHGKDRIMSEKLVAELVKDANSLWAAYNRDKPITQRQIANLLEPYDIRPRTIRIGNDADKRGYQLAWFQDAFETYL